MSAQAIEAILDVIEENSLGPRAEVAVPQRCGYCKWWLPPCRGKSNRFGDCIHIRDIGLNLTMATPSTRSGCPAWERKT